MYSGSALKGAARSLWSDGNKVRVALDELGFHIVDGFVLVHPFAVGLYVFMAGGVELSRELAEGGQGSV
jgi:hypothetical protein